MSTIYFVRHGQSEANVADCINDDPNRIVKLTSIGRHQCISVADQLRTVPLTRAFASEFHRAQESLGIILQHRPDVTQHIDPRLNEWKTGMDGAPIDYFHRQMEHGFVPPEDFEDVVTRMENFLNDVERTADAGDLLVVSHKITILAGLVAIGSLPFEDAKRYTVDNAEVIAIPL